VGSHRLGVALAEVAPPIAPVSVDIDGLGVFDGPHPVVFLRVAQTPA
jgi:hypothetical protein